MIYPGEAHEFRRPSFVRDRMVRYLEWYGRYLGTECVAGQWDGAAAGQGR